MLLAVHKTLDQELMAMLAQSLRRLSTKEERFVQAFRKKLMLANDEETQTDCGTGEMLTVCTHEYC